MKTKPFIAAGCLSLLFAGQPVAALAGGGVACVHDDEKLEKDIGYCQTVRVGNTLHVSGVASDGPMPEAIGRVYGELDRILKAHGASLKDVVKETVYTTDLDSFIQHRRLRSAFLQDHLPGATWVGVRRLYLPTMVLEVEVVAETGAGPVPDSVLGSGPAEERRAVLQTLNDYLLVTDQREKAVIARAMHPTAPLSSVTPGGAVRHMTQEEWWERVSRIPDGTPPRKTALKILDVVGVSALARIDITDARGATSTDMLTLLKTREGWRVVGKVLSVAL